MHIGFYFNGVLQKNNNVEQRQLKLVSKVQKVFGAVVAAFAINAEQAAADTQVPGQEFAGAHKNYILLDKKTSQMTVVENGKVILATPALTGKLETEELGVFGATPAGTFPLNILHSDNQFKSVLGILCNSQKGCWTVHPVLKGGMREGFLKSASTGDNLQTVGCVAVFTDIYPELEKFTFRNSNYATGELPVIIILPKDHKRIPEFFPNAAP